MLRTYDFRYGAIAIRQSATSLREAAEIIRDKWGFAKGFVEKIDGYTVAQQKVEDILTQPLTPTAD